MLLPCPYAINILIHTSVKLVTQCRFAGPGFSIILIHTSVKLVTRPMANHAICNAILIHTSVKLVTTLRL